MKITYHNLSILILFIGVLFLINTGKVFSFCLPTTVNSNCNENYNCEENLGSIEGNNPAFCDTFSQSCYEVVYDGSSYLTFCFASLGAPTPTHAPCGTLNYICCSPPNFCQNNLVPQSTEPGNCFCVEPDSPLPTSLPNPTGTPKFPTATPFPTVSDKNDGGVNCKTEDNKDGVQTALGCIPTEPMDLVEWLFPFLLGFGGLAAFGLIVFSGIQLMTSGGDPQKIQGAKETITSAITGLIFIILSLFLLRLIGVDILGLPGLE